MSGSANTDASWLALPTHVATIVPSATVPACPLPAPTAASAAATRGTQYSGGSIRSASSTAAGTSDSSARTRSHRSRAREQPVEERAHRVGRRLGAGDDQDAHHRDELGIGEAVAPLLGVHEAAHEVVAGVGAALLHLVEDVGAEVGVARGRLARVRRRDRLVGPLEELLAVGGGDAEQPEEDDGGHRPGELAHELGLTPSGERVDELVGDLVDPRRRLRDRPLGERLVDELAHALVLVAVEVDDVLHLTGRQGTGRAAAERLGVAEHGGDGLVTGDEVEAGEVVQRALRVELGEWRVRIGDRHRGMEVGVIRAAHSATPR